MADSHPYLGTDLSPEEYYRVEAAHYANPHAAGIAAILERMAHHLHGRVLDLGCGDGLVTKLLAGRGLIFVGADSAPAMVARYEAETGFSGVVASFEDPMPPADCVVSSYALHLATPAQLAMLWWRLAEAGAERILVITPFKEKPPEPEHYYHLIETVSGPFGPDGKTIHGRVYARGEA
ncbi:MAG TPA: class I SAM-dependent methyltransferase [Oscillatoriaceae cyanobacterium]